MFALSLNQFIPISSSRNFVCTLTKCVLKSETNVLRLILAAQRKEETDYNWYNDDVHPM